MENGMGMAIEQMAQKEEAGLNYIYSKTYNFVYLRAKSILKNEEDVKQLMQKVYLEAFASMDGLRKENLYEWLGKRTYLLGCQSYKKRKEREISFLEMDKNELNPRKIENSDISIDIICNVLAELPDLYQATLFAFYYDYLKIEEIAELMDCSSGIVRNRLNYVRKYIKKAMENYVEELDENEKIKITFSVEVLCNALRKWSVDHCLGITTAQSVYFSICREAGLKPDSVYLEGKEFAGVNNTVVYHKQDAFHVLEEEILHHAKKQGIVVMNKEQMPYLIGIAAVVLILIVAAVFVFGRPKKEKPMQKKPAVENETKDKESGKEASGHEENEPVDSGEPQDPQKPESAEDVPSIESEYIFPNSATEKLTREEIQQHTKEELRLGRNEIYARHGVIFGVEDLDSYFKSKSWYQPKVSLSDFSGMSMLEEENISLIKEIEASMEE